jgi:putative FmdB family regulatory protein
MPLYEYRCESCGEREERLESFSAPTQHDCGKCGTPSGMLRQLSLTSFTLAGGGWHAQGYSGVPQPGSAPAEAKSAPAGPAGGCCSGCACHPGKAGN